MSTASCISNYARVPLRTDTPRTFNAHPRNSLHGFSRTFKSRKCFPPSRSMLWGSGACSDDTGHDDVGIGIEEGRRGWELGMTSHPSRRRLRMMSDMALIGQ